jgi:signal transduction histidine kinase
MDARETSLYTAILIVCLTVGSIIVFFIISLIRQQRRNLALYRQSVLAEITAMEKERTRIAADLHDELGPMLSAIKLKINSFELTDEDDKLEVEKTNMHIDGLVKKMREISYDLIPNTLIRKGLVQALTEFAEFINRAQKIQIQLEAPNIPPINENKAIHIYRVIQEIVNNALKHSKAETLNITLKQEGGTLFLQTIDNGVGFDVHAATKGDGGIGLRNLLSRCEIIGGKMFVDSEKAKGTKYTFEIPV